MSETKSKFLEKIKKDKKLQYLIITVLLVVVILIFVANVFKADTKTETITDSIELYVSNLEKRLSESLSKVDGADNVSVVINVESGMETVLATKKVVTENQSGTTVEESPILVNGKPVVIKEMYPKISGVLIVAKGADNISVFYKIQQATVSLLDIDVNKIQILSMK